ncbi:unnamed protein product [Calicophoron daubneyi]|uniref:Cupin type-2 domain-containing protein n=1 Tax=Calicophoron daubneyi TaxID=300641 RepID=A0AAV2TQ77_CALDB
MSLRYLALDRIGDRVSSGPYPLDYAGEQRLFVRYQLAAESLGRPQCVTILNWSIDSALSRPSSSAQIPVQNLESYGVAHVIGRQVLNSYTDMSKFTIHRWNESKDGKLNLQSMLDWLKKEGCSCVDYKFNPGTSFSEHTHSQNKLDCIVTGHLWFKMMGEEVILGPGDRIEIPRNTPHCARVEGNEVVTYVDATRS